MIFIICISFAWNSVSKFTHLRKKCKLQFRKKNETFDFFVEIGTPGPGHDDISTTHYLISNDTDLIMGDTFGMRLTSMGDNHEGSRI